MLYFFYFTRNILGLIMVISPIIGLLFIDLNSDLFIVFLAGMLFGILLGMSCLKRVPFRLWTNLAAAVFLLSSLGGILVQNPYRSWIFAAAAGLCVPVLAAFLPAHIAAGWFRGSKVQVLGLVWSISLILGFLLKIIMKRFTYLTFIIAAVMMLAGTGLLLQKPPCLTGCRNAVLSDPVYSAHQKQGILRTFIFFICISFTAGLSFFLPAEPVIIDFFLSEKDFLIAALCAGPVAAALFARFKSIYSCSIWILFLAEITMFCSGQPSDFIMADYIEALSVGLCLGGLSVIIPVMTYYVCGPLKYSDSLGKITVSIPAGFFLALITANTVSGVSFVPWICAGAMILLTFAFFTIFSAWKNRLFLLKSPDL